MFQSTASQDFEHPIQDAFPVGRFRSLENRIEMRKKKKNGVPLLVKNVRLFNWFIREHLPTDVLMIVRSCK